MLRHASLVAAGTLCAGLAAAAPIGHVLDLGRQAPEAATTVAVPPGESLTIVLRNRIPRASYAVSVQRRPIDIPPLEPPTGGARSAAGRSPCDPYLDEADSLAGLPGPQDEIAVANSVDHLEGALALGVCTSADDVKRITLALASTVWPIQGSWILKPGEELVVTVTRKLSSGQVRKWELVLTTGPRGRWLTSWGFAAYPNHDQKLFANSDGTGKFVVTPETEPDEWDLKLVPAAFFTWLPSARATSDFAFGLSGGLGVKEDSPVVFFGGSMLYNWNLALVAGLGIAQQWRPLGRYSPDQVITENLSSEQLNEKVFRPNFMIAVTYRFGSNPFGGSSQQATTPKPTASPTPNPAATPTPTPTP